MSVHWVEAVAACWMKSPEQLVEEALAFHGFRVTSRKILTAGVAEPASNGTFRWSHWRSGADIPFIWVSDIDRGLGCDWWITLSVLLDGFVLGYEKWDFRDIHRIVLNLSGKPLENRLYLPSLTIPDARTLWDERCGLLFDVHPGTLNEATLLQAEDWRLEAIGAGSPPSRLTGGRALLANISESRFRELAAGNLGDWAWRPWTTPLPIPVIDLWNPAHLDAGRVKQWAETADCFGLAWDLDGDEWRCLEFIGKADHYDTSTRDVITLVNALSSGTTAIGEPVVSLGGHGPHGWRRNFRA